MSSDFHTPIPFGANADNSVFNAPLGELDQAIFDLVEGEIPFSALHIGAAALHASAIGQAHSETQGLRLPRLSTSQRNAIASPAQGLMIYNTDEDSVNYYDGGIWISTLSPGSDTMKTIIAPTPVAAAFSITLSNIPQTYEHLILRLRLKATSIGTGGILRFNNHSGASNYSWMLSLVDIGGGTISHVRDVSDSLIHFPIPPASAGLYSDYRFIIRDYAQNAPIFGSYEGAGYNVSSAYVWGGFRWDDTTAINEINILPGLNVTSFDGLYSLYGLGAAL